MKWKEIDQLLSPTAAKIIIFLALFAVFVPVVEHDNGVRCVTAPCPSSSYSSAMFYILSPYKEVYQILSVSAVAGIIATYLIACLLVSLARYFRK